MGAGRSEPVVLVVEDDIAHLQVLEREFRGQGFSVRTAYDGWQALELALALRPDLITLEMDVPHESAIWFYRRRALWPELLSVPLVVITRMKLGNGDSGAVFTRAMEMEGLPSPNAYLVKPVQPQDLRRVIDAFTPGADGRAGNAALGSAHPPNPDSQRREQRLRNEGPAMPPKRGVPDDRQP